MRGRYLRYDERARRAVAFIDAYVKDNGVSPSVREIAAGVGYIGPGATHALLRKMENDGMVDRVGQRIPRTIRVRHQPITPPRDRNNEL